MAAVCTVELASIATLTVGLGSTLGEVRLYLCSPL